MRTPFPARRANPSPPIEPALGSGSLQPQPTRLQRQVVDSGAALSRWASNPWRRLALLLIVLLLGFVIGGGVGTICGALAFIDHLAALFCVIAMEFAIRARRWLLRQRGDHLGLELLDMGRIGLLYGLLLDGFKLF
ncbi:DUF565 domain-containing protein [Synechococcus sp. CS-1328]|uniref:DUF565 domain-containing protein n=1 Tax=Synechococcus sp. CS-1328 TaxID=2847976 RepID=UPI00223AFE43|nr:DUF565 domain-containing protein [Synechococcus sp. CS-1328]MCT0224524.1 DUF565 domain-containing protein [Synechococcus sp. CS-1328]